MPPKSSKQLDREIRDALARPARSAARPDLQTVRAQLRDLGVVESIYERDGDITIAKIVVPAQARGEGTGTKAMKLLTEYADKTGQRIVLTPSEDFGASSVPRLVGFYKRFGFVENKGRKRDFTTRESMIRNPIVHSEIST